MGDSRPPAVGKPRQPLLKRANPSSREQGSATATASCGTLIFQNPTYIISKLHRLCKGWRGRGLTGSSGLGLSSSGSSLSAGSRDGHNGARQLRSTAGDGLPATGHAAPRWQARKTRCGSGGETALGSCPRHDMRAGTHAAVAACTRHAPTRLLLLLLLLLLIWHLQLAMREGTITSAMAVIVCSICAVLLPVLPHAGMHPLWQKCAPNGIGALQHMGEAHPPLERPAKPEAC